MTVCEVGRIDQVAVGANGRLILAMTEDRDYGPGADAELIEDFRRKLNAYLGAVRSGEVRRMARKAGVAGENGVDIVLFSVSEPPQLVREMLDTVNSKLSKEGISARYELL
ncbi:DUF6572 domain-containing protein [Nocardia salmonicida]|uniref:DUF6572 domain-containing protein n=1 Tax=Nocardia salmonicida TaxID=53431 RepID=UPI003789A028